MDAALRSLLDWYARAGVDVPLVPAARRVKPQTKPQMTQPSQEREPTPKTQPRPQEDVKAEADIIQAAQMGASKAQDLSELQIALTKFDAGAMSDNSRGAVFGAGNASAKLMIIGEGATREDDIAGVPLSGSDSGSDGALLARMLGAIGLGKEDYYTALTVPWRLMQGRGGQSRAPSESEINISRPFLIRHIELAAPDHLVLLGSTPMRALLGPNSKSASIMKDHGQWQSVKIGARDIPAIAIYHPSLLRRQPDLKKEAWRDLLTLREALLSAGLDTGLDTKQDGAK